MSRDALLQTLSQLIQAIQLCIERKLQLPAVMLLYAGIDICGWLASPDGELSTRETFTKWVETYLVPAKALPCTATELYAARCGVLHTYTPESDLATKGKARRIAYAWGDAQASDLQRTIDLERRSDLVALHISDLLEAFRLGMSSYFEDLDRNPALAASFESKASKSFAPASKQLISDYLNRHDPTLPGA